MACLGRVLQNNVVREDLALARKQGAMGPRAEKTGVQWPCPPNELMAEDNRGDSLFGHMDYTICRVNV